MDLTNMKKGICTLKLENLQKVYNEQGEIDPTLIKATFSIIDFNVSANGQQISKIVALESAYSFKNKPLLCGYMPTTNYEDQNDDFTSHEEYAGKLRTGEDYIFTNTHAIGVSPEKAYIGVIKNDNNEDIDALLADFVLWKYRYPNEILLINDFYEKGEALYSSCEYYYTSSTTENGIETINKLYFDGHTILGRNVEPAYSNSKLISFNSKWNKAMNQINKTEFSVLDKSNNQKEDESVAGEMFKKVCELSFDDIRSCIYQNLKTVLSDEEYYDSYITECYESYFILSYWSGSEHKYYKATYTKSDDNVTVDWENKKEVFLYQEWREIPEVQTVLNEKTTVENELQEVKTQLNTTITEKESISQKFNEATDKLTSLNSKITEMNGIVEKYNTEQTEKALNEKKEFYGKKFIAVNAKEKYDSEEVQNLIKMSINDSDDGKDAIMQLNTMLVDLVEVKNTNGDTNKSINELCSKRTNLIEVKNDVESKYFD